MMTEKATPGCLDTLMSIFSRARRYMEETGNPNQWTDGYPDRDTIAADIRNGNCYVCRNDEGKIVATFALIIGRDPTYTQIQGGSWTDDDEYGVIHRMASDGSMKGMGKQCIDWCFKRIRNIRIDTHRDNLTMQHIVLGYGFKYCGIIYTHNHTPRLAYQLHI